jgi:MarR family transcriptional regulator, transcriptional regulator for hemolysin
MSTGDSTEIFGQLVHGTARAWRQKLDERLKPMGLSQAKWRTLMHLSLAGDALTQAEIATRLGVEEPTVVNLIHRLERESWIIRKTSLHDRRCKMVLLGRRAQRVIAQISATAAKLRHELLAGIPSGDVETCMQVLGLIQKRAEKSDRRQSTPRSRPPHDSVERNGHTKQRYSITRKGASSRRVGGFR